MDDADLGAYQEALISALMTGRGAADVKWRLARSRAARPYAAYVSRFEPRVTELHARVTRAWTRREGEPKKVAKVNLAVYTASFYLRVCSAASKAVPEVRAGWVRDWLRATADVPRVPFWRVAGEVIGPFDYYDSATLAYARPLALLAEAGVESVRGKKVLELAYRSVLPLQLLGLVGARTVGVTRDSWKRRVHAELFERPTRALKLVEGAFPSAETRRAVGTSYDLVLGWNAFEREPLAEGADVPTALASITKSGAHVLLYAAGAAPRSSTRQRPTFTRRSWERAGFRPLAFERDDSRPLRGLGRALDWHDVDGVWARYSLFERE